MAGLPILLIKFKTLCNFLRKQICNHLNSNRSPQKKMQITMVRDDLERMTNLFVRNKSMYSDQFKITGKLENSVNTGV